MPSAASGSPEYPLRTCDPFRRGAVTSEWSGSVTRHTKSKNPAMPSHLSSSADGLDERGSCRPLAAATPCAFECGGPQLYRFDLSLLALSAQPGYLHAVGTDGKSYYFGACDAVRGVACEGAAGEGAAVAIQAWSGAPPSIPMGSCAVLGAASPRNCSLSAATPGDTQTGMGMVCKYAGAERHVDV